MKSLGHLILIAAALMEAHKADKIFITDDGCGFLEANEHDAKVHAESNHFKVHEIKKSELEQLKKDNPILDPPSGGSKIDPDTPSDKWTVPTIESYLNENEIPFPDGAKKGEKLELAIKHFNGAGEVGDE